MLGENVIADLLVQFRGDSRDLDRDLGRVDRNLGKSEKRARRFGGAFAGALAGGLAATWSWGAIKGAGDLDEALNKSEVIFGEHADAVKQWATDSEYAMYFTETAANDYASTLGNLFTGSGIAQTEAAEKSMELTERAADMASIHNTTVEDALQAMRSGLVGETEPLRRYGVMLDAASLKAKAMELGLIKEGEQLDNASKSRAAYALIMEKSAITEGDALKTQDSMANKIKITETEYKKIKDTIGQQLLPVASELTGVLSRTLKVLGPFIPTLVKLAGAFLGVWVAMKGYGIMRDVIGAGRSLIGTLGSALRRVNDFSGGMRGVGGASRGAGRGITSFIGKAGLIGAALAGTTYAIYEAVKAWRAYRDAAREAEEAYQGAKSTYGAAEQYIVDRYGEGSERHKKWLKLNKGTEAAIERDRYEKPWWDVTSWFAEGGDFVVDQPTVFGAGEAGPERVQITPMDQVSARTPVIKNYLVLGNKEIEVFSRQLAYADARVGQF